MSRWIHGTGLALLGIWAVVFALLLVSGQYKMYLVPVLWPLLLVAVILLSLFIVAKFKLGRSHECHGPGNAVVIRTGLLILPLLYLLWGHGESLGSYAFSKRNVWSDFESRGSSSAESLRKNDRFAGREWVEGEEIEVNILEVLWSFVRLSGKKIVTLGRLAIDETLPTGNYVLFRFAISCCVADARPVAVLIDFQEEMTIAQDAWVQVTGEVKVKKVRGRSTLVIQAESIEEVGEPEELYLYSY